MVGVAAANAWLGYSFGGYYIGEWGIFALLVVVMLLISTALGFLGGMRSRAGVVAVALLMGYTLWTFLSILWSANQGDAWYGSTLTLLYLLVFWVAATLVAAGLSRRLALSALTIGPGAVALLTIPMLTSGASGDGNFFLDGRLMGPTGYFNAQAAFLLISFWSGIYLAGSRRVHPFVRGLSLASTVVCLEVAVLTQSRGTALAFLASLVVFFFLSGRRTRGLLAFLPVAACTFLAFPTLNEVYLQLSSSETVTGASLSAIDRAETVILVSGVVALIYGVAWGLTERSWHPSQGITRIVKLSCLALVAAGLLLGSFAVVERIGSPVSFAQERWVAFKTNDSSGQDESRYLSASGSGRFALWGVAWRDFEQNPILGVGTHNYEATYYQYRPDVTGWVKQPHSLPLEVVAERGIVGGALFFGFLGVCVVTGLHKRFMLLNSEGKGQIGAVMACLTYWFVHSSAEWFWQIPAITIPALIYLAMIVVPWVRVGEDEEVFWPLDRPLRLAGIGLAVLALAAVGPLYLSDYYKQRSDAADNPWISLGQLERAQTFDPLNSNLAREEGDMAYRIGDIPRASESYARAIALNPDYYANYSVLGGFYEQLGEPQRALDLYRKAEELNPMDDEMVIARERAQAQVEALQNAST